MGANASGAASRARSGAASGAASPVGSGAAGGAASRAGSGAPGEAASNAPGGPPGRDGTSSSVVRDVRRRQIVAAAIRVLAREGHGGTSLSRVAAEAGLSSAGLVTYYFTDRRQLLSAVVADVTGRYDAAVVAAVAAAPDARAGLAAYIDAAVRFQDRNRDDVRALWQVIWSRTEDSGEPVIDKDSQLRPLLELLERGGAAGEFRTDIRDPRWVAKSIQATVIGYLDALLIDPDLDAADYIDEVQRIFALATDRPAGSPRRKEKR